MRSLDLLVIGAMKAGTTSVHKYLSEHPEIYLPPEKEAPFFSDDAAYRRGYSHYFNDFFRDAKPDAFLGTVSPLYMMNPVAPQRIRDTCPDVKLIAVLRDPIERAYSQYKMAMRIKGETRTFEQAMVEQLEEAKLLDARNRPDYWSDYVIFGEYGRILKAYYELFPNNQMKILYMSQLAGDPIAFMSEIFDFLGVETVTIRSLGKKFHDSNLTGIRPLVARIGFNPMIRSVGKHFLSNRIRRRVRFWLGLHRSFGGARVDSRFLISPETRKKLESLYFADGNSLSNLTGQLPYWIANWQRQRDH